MRIALMPPLVNRLAKKNLLLTPPGCVVDNTHYEVIMGSEAYGVSSNDSDRDIYGFCIPGKEVVFPHLNGEVQGFGRQKKRFEQFLQHHIVDKDARGGTGIEYDVTIYNIVKYFHLVMENNPNMIDSLFVPDRCILFMTPIGAHVRSNRHLFLHKGGFHKLKGYAFSQIHKMKIKNPEEGSKRAKDVDAHGYDTKYAMHLVRLMLQAEQLLIEGTLDLERNSEQLKSIRRGEWPEEDVYKFFSEKEVGLERLYLESKVQHSPDESKIKALLLDCLEMNFGSLKNVVVRPDRALSTMEEVCSIVDKYRGLT